MGRCLWRNYFLSGIYFIYDNVERYLLLNKLQNKKINKLKIILLCLKFQPTIISYSQL